MICSDRDCEASATCAIRTTHGGSNTNGLKITIFTHASDAPTTASFYCTDHGSKLAGDLVRTMAS